MGRQQGSLENLVRKQHVRILITGNMGYVGPGVVRHLRAKHPAAQIIGYDTGFFAHCTTGVSVLPEKFLDEQYFGDVRELPAELLRGTDVVVQLAAVSNDPMGNRFQAVTHEINCESSVRLAEMARDAGVRGYIFASSCSVYGAGGDKARREGDEVNPLTAYARSKIETENLLSAMDCGTMIVTCLRFATACGMSDRLRLDLVLNDFVACALVNRNITVLSDGTPWRPLIDVADMARAVDWAANRPASNGGAKLIVNVGLAEWNYQVKELAHAVAEAVPGTELSINTNAQPDKRSYRVDFSLYKSLAPDHQPQMTLASSILALREGLSRMGFSDKDFRNSANMRLKVLEAHIESGRLLPDLRWNPAQETP
jgi:nucleoside-diphosphate-sugar epimerase